MVIQFDFTDEEGFICIKIIKPQRPCSFSVCVPTSAFKRIRAPNKCVPRGFFSDRIYH